MWKFLLKEIEFYKIKGVLFFIMKKVRIVADRTCDLSEELIAKYDIAIIPLCIIMDEKSYFDGIEVKPEEIFAWANKNKTTPKWCGFSFKFNYGFGF